MGTNLKRLFKSAKIPTLIAAVCTSSAVCVQNAYSAELIWVGDFETGDTSQYKTKLSDGGQYGHSKVVTSPVRHGKYAAELVVDGGNLSGANRSELLSNTPTGKIRFDWDGPEYWAGFSLYFKEWAAQGNTFFQIHAPNEPEGSSCDYAGNAFTIRPSGNGGTDSSGGLIEDKLSVNVLDNPSGVSSGKGASSNNKSVHSMTIPTGVWIDYVVHFKLSTKGQGFYEVWKDGKLVYSESNLTNVNWKDSCGNVIPADKSDHNGLHVGIYASKENQYRRVYADELRVAQGAGADGYDLVAPPNGGGGGGEVALAPPAPPTGLE